MGELTAKKMIEQAKADETPLHSGVERCWRQMVEAMTEHRNELEVCVPVDAWHTYAQERVAEEAITDGVLTEVQEQPPLQLASGMADQIGQYQQRHR